jgi:hypothetical protein
VGSPPALTLTPLQSGRVIRSVHGSARPAFDPPVELRGLPHVDPQTAVIVIAGVQAGGLGVVPFECRTAELGRIRAGHLEPEALGPRNVGGLVDVDAIANLSPINFCCIEESQEEGNELGVTVDEVDALLLAIGLALSTLSPVGNGASDEQFPLGQRADLGSRDGAGGLPLRLAGGAFNFPVAADPLSCPLAALFIAESVRPGQIMHPGRDRAFRDTQLGGDPVVVVALPAQNPGRSMEIVFGGDGVSTLVAARPREGC